MTERDIKYLLLIPILIVCALALVPVYLVLTLPTADAVLAAGTFKAVFKEGPNFDYDPAFPNDEGDYPRFTQCALRINHEEGKRMAMRIADRLATGSLLPHDLKKEALYYPLRYRYAMNARRKIYLALYATSSRFPGIDQACKGLFEKSCKDLSEREAVQLATWVEGQEKLFEKIRNDDAYIQKQIEDVRIRCGR